MIYKLKIFTNIFQKQLYIGVFEKIIKNQKKNTIKYINLLVLKKIIISIIVELVEKVNIVLNYQLKIKNIYIIFTRIIMKNYMKF